MNPPPKPSRRTGILRVQDAAWNVQTTESSLVFGRHQTVWFLFGRSGQAGSLSYRGGSSVRGYLNLTGLGSLLPQIQNARRWCSASAAVLNLREGYSA